MLVLGGVNVWRDGAVLLRDVSLSVRDPGLLWIVGPGGAGKSSLLGALAGESLGGRVEMRGHCTLAGHELSALGRRRAFLQQQAHEAAPADAVAGLTRERRAERHFAAVMDVLSRDASIYLVDEPTAGLDEEQACRVRERLQSLSRRAVVVGVTHNRQDCLAAPGMTALLAGGTIHEIAESERFFDEPSTEAGRVYVATGNCGIAVTNAPAPVRNGIWWAVPGLLCGMSRPGLVGDVLDAYRELAASGVRRLLCLEDRCAYPTQPLREAGISLHRFAIPDMAPPSFSQAVDICRLAEPSIRSNEGIAAHCRGGLGRTGTVLASILVWFGDAAATAIERVRGAQPHAIQSPAQQRFLHDFADRIRGWR